MGEKSKLSPMGLKEVYRQSPLENEYKKLADLGSHLHAHCLKLHFIKSYRECFYVVCCLDNIITAGSNYQEHIFYLKQGIKKISE
ncbi:hypothetical protein HZS_5894 [Henneguya salminicola]|nr:hypothetical protein HZS_5894 [Henneguya salminicola]